MTRPRLVFDTNVLTSGLLTDNSVPQKIFDYAQTKAILLISEETFQQLAEVLTRSKFDRYIALEKRAKFLNLLNLKAEMIEIKTKINLCRDPKDNKFLELAVNGKANYLISGDQDLLILNPFQKISILSPQAFTLTSDFQQ
ncbi:MAG: putative toxin-antitoxin system toxin component, PIN family [Merismopediaceae bacterium]|nr:putative toxin-antitoxin system toxin component, PIN family [Merismopediaceae bacterium]